MDTWALLLRMAALMTVATAVGVSLTYWWVLRPAKDIGLNIILLLSFLALLLLTENFVVRLFGLPMSWITIAANLYFITLGAIMVRSAVGVYKYATELRFAEDVEQQVLRKLKDDDE